MPLISQEDQDFLRDRFSKELVDPINLVLFTQHDSPLAAPTHECMYCRETRELLEEIAGLSDKIDLTIYDFVADAAKAREYGVDKIPAVVVDGARGVRYFGIPAGYEFSSLIEDIIDVSDKETDLLPETRDAVKKIDKDVHIQVFVTPT